MGDTPGTPSVNQSPLVAALSTPSMYHNRPNGGGYNGSPQYPPAGIRPPQAGGWPLNQSHNEGSPYPPPNGTPGPMRVGQPINIRPGPYPPRPGFPGQHGLPQQVVVQRHMPPGPHQMIQQQVPMHGPPVPAPQIMHLPQTTGGIIDKVRLDDLVKQIDSNTYLEDNVKDTLIEYCDDFISDVINKVCNLATYRTIQQQQPSKKIEVRDVEMVLNMAYNMPSVPRAAVHVFAHPPTSYPKLDGHPPTDAHKQRLMLIKKQLKKI